MAVILITGASSGIGHDTAIALAKKGHKVYGGVRQPHAIKLLKDQGVSPLYLDVTDETLCQDAVNRIVEIEGGIDVLINNAGYGLFGAVEDVSIAEAKKQFEVNIFGLARLTQMVLPFMRQQGSGRIINVSSVGGRIVSFMGAWYHASKYAVEALSDALRMEVSSFGIDVVLIEPGGVKTDWWKKAVNHLTKVSEGGAYQTAALQASEGMLKLRNAKMLSDPSVISKGIMKAVNKKKPKARYLVGCGAKTLLFLHNVLPTKCYDWLVKRSMGVKK